MSYTFKLTHSLEKIFFSKDTKTDTLEKASMFKNEIYSFQLCAAKDGPSWPNKTSIHIDVESELKPFIRLFAIDYIPVYYTGGHIGPVGDYLASEPGLFPDVLREIPDGNGFLYNQQMRAFWIMVEPNGQIHGTYPINITVSDCDSKEVLGTLCMTLTVFDRDLPPLDIITTGWFHCDSLAVVHNVPMMSDAHMEIIEKYIKTYTKFGHNMILTPIFTPPLDTAVGHERPTMQLVDVTRENGKYTFDFSKLDTFIEMAERNGIKYFEMAHLFTQWGAAHAPKIMATVDGEYKRIFGWDTEVLGTEYTFFLSVFIPALADFFKAKNMQNRVFFHISDEPTREHLDHYGRLKAFLSQYLGDFRIMDALSNYEFYEKGYVDLPVVAIDHAAPFFENKVSPMFLYYCCAQSYRVANRYIAMPASRNRVLGAQLYKYNVQGFLQWGYNFYFSQYSRAPINPYMTTDAEGAFQGGDPFIVYPLNEAGEVTLSMRFPVFNEGLQDLRAMKLLETLVGREQVLSLFPEIESLADYPREGQYYVTLREKINRCIMEAIG